VPFPAGDSSEVPARPIGQKLTERWAQPVAIENRLDAANTVGAQTGFSDTART
jgi:tripartite-type tricarboxylate transporter receptor subunit TctC